MEGMVTLNRKEQKRLMVLNEVERGKMRGGEAAGVLGISLRQTWRLLAAYRRKGASGLAHGNRGRKPVNAIREEVRSQIVDLAATRYAGFNHQHLTELLADGEGIQLSR